MSLLTGIVSYYQFQGNSNDVADGNNGTDTSITYSNTNGKIGEGAGFNGTSSFISLGDPSNLHNSAFSISLWCKPAAASNFPTLVAKNYTAAPWTSPYASILLRFDYATTGDIELGLSNGSSYTANNFASAPGTGSFHHVVATYDGTTGIMYLDNTSLGSASYGVTLAYSAQQWSIGADNGGSPMGDYFDGAIDEIGIWSRALSSAEVSQLYNSGSGLTYPFGTQTVFGSTLLMMGV